MKPVKVGLLGCGAIAPAYLHPLTSVFGNYVEVVACADVVPSAAKARAEEFGVPLYCSPDALLRHPEIEIVLNLTPAPRHHAVSRSILQAGKHLFSEKPLALTMAEGREILQEAKSRNLHVAGASDTFLGSGLQTARRVVDDGKIGQPLAAQVLVAIGMASSERYHRVFRGALLDLGPYYLSALIALFGPVRRISAMSEIRFPYKKILDPEGRDTGQGFATDIASTASGCLEFVSGEVATVLSSCDVHGYFPRVEVFGSEGSMFLGDANSYGDLPKVRNREGTMEVEPEIVYGAKGRGLGVAEMALALREDRSPRACGSLMLHVLEIMTSFAESSQEGRHMVLQTMVERPDPFFRPVLRE